MQSESKFGNRALNVFWLVELLQIPEGSQIMLIGFRSCFRVALQFALFLWRHFDGEDIERLVYHLIFQVENVVRIRRDAAAIKLPMCLGIYHAIIYAQLRSSLL